MVVLKTRSRILAACLATVPDQPRLREDFIRSWYSKWGRRVRRSYHAHFGNVLHATKLARAVQPLIGYYSSVMFYLDAPPHEPEHE